MGHGHSKEKPRKREDTGTSATETNPQKDDPQSEGKPDDGSEARITKGKKEKTSKAERRRSKQQEPDEKKPLQQRRVSFYETVDASEVLPFLIVGNQASARDEEFLTRKNVHFILNLTNEQSKNKMEGIEYKCVMMEDDEEEELSAHFEGCFEFINKARSSSSKKQTKTILVHSYLVSRELPPSFLPTS